MTFAHTTVLLEEAVSALTAGSGRRYLDCTLGGGGHAARLLETCPEAEVLGLDCDETALQAAATRLAPFAGRFHLRHSRFSGLMPALREIGWEQVDGVLFDLGVSSPQIDTPERGFSIRFDAPLDMRMDTSAPLTAADLLNQTEEQDLANLIYQFGEEKRSRAIARAIVERRRLKPWTRTGELAELLEKIVGRARQHGLPPATRTFQALRIAVNRELQELQEGLQGAISCLAPGGRLVVITFHSLEDRIVKQTIRDAASSCVCPPGLPVCHCHKQPVLRPVTRKPLLPGEEETRTNRRAACAKMRVAEKL